MKFFRYKQACRLTFNGLDDELNNVASSYYITKYKLLNNTEINTKLLSLELKIYVMLSYPKMQNLY